MDSIEDKKTQIINAAIRRFSHFGISKTTMSEIAEDTHLSKANLYYYFPDKVSLIEAIASLLVEESAREVAVIFKKNKDVETRLLSLLDLKFQYFRKYQLLIQQIHEAQGIDPRLNALAQTMYNRELEQIGHVLEEGVLSGELVTMSLDETSNLYVTMQRGLTISTMSESSAFPFADEKFLEQVYKLQKQAIHIFVNGIRSK